MAEISRELADIINDKESLKVIATTDAQGNPHVVFKGTLHTEGQDLVFYDLLQSSQVNKNLVSSIWFGRKVAINILAKDKRSFLITAKPRRSVTAGRVFEEVYASLKDRNPDGDLNAIWYLEPEHIEEKTFAVRRAEEEAAFPILKHLDRLVKEERS
ncbi:MAG: hypothetical protein K5891_03095 [Lachnospiraceae bacterium]|nr:hypothetical protein [Lachnospiraceae bacterium]